MNDPPAVYLIHAENENAPPLIGFNKVSSRDDVILDTSSPTTAPSAPNMISLSILSICPSCGAKDRSRSSIANMQSLCVARRSKPCETQLPPPSCTVTNPLLFGVDSTRHLSSAVTAVAVQYRPVEDVHVEEEEEEEESTH